MRASSSIQRQSPCIRVIRTTSQRPYRSARERLRERVVAARARGLENTASSERVAPARCGEVRRDEFEGREPTDQRDDFLCTCSDSSTTMVGNTTCTSKDGSTNCSDLTAPPTSLSAMTRKGMMFSTEMASSVWGEMSSVDQRFRAMSMSVAAAPPSLAIPASSSSAASTLETRRRILMKLLGMQRFYKTMALVRDIRGVQEKLLVSTCGGPKQRGSKTITSAIKKQLEECLPAAAKTLVLDTPLMRAMEQTPLDQLDQVPWEELIRQARHNLHAYREWLSLSETRE